MTQPVIRLRQPQLDELRAAARRQVAALPIDHNTARPENHLRIKTLGKWGEAVLATYLCVDLPATELNRHNYADDEDVYGIQVRATTHAAGHLITHDRDKPAPYVLVTIERVNYDLVRGTIRGWTWLHECNQPKRWHTHVNGIALRKPCYMTSQTLLQPIDTVPIPQQLKGQP